MLTMNRISRSLLAVLLLSAVTAPASAQDDRARNLKLIPQEGPLKGKQIYNNSHALLIGINQYPNLPQNRWLEYAVKDVEAVKEVLTKHYGFPAGNVKTLLNEQATLANIKQALSDYSDKRVVQPEDRILIYFSGHGQTVKLPLGGDMGFLLPYDAKVDLDDFENAGPYLNTCIGMDTVKNYLDATPAKHTLILADACYSGLLVGQRGIQPSPATLLALTAKRATQIMTAGGRGQPSVELARFGHGAFTYKLLEELKARAVKPGDAFHAFDLYSNLSVSVPNLTEGKQLPQFGALSATEGQFFFIVAGDASAAVQNPGQPAQPETPAAGGAAQAVDTVARIRVTTAPPGAKIFVDDADTGKVSPATVEIDLGRLKSKDVELAVELEGHKAVVQKATLERGKVLPLDLKLTAVATKAAEPPQKPAVPAPKQDVEKPAIPAAPAAGADAARPLMVRNFKAGASVRARTTATMPNPILGEMKAIEVFTVRIAEVDEEGNATLRHDAEQSEVVTVAGRQQVPIGPAKSEQRDRLGRPIRFAPYEDTELLDADVMRLIDTLTDPVLSGKPAGPGESWSTTVPNPLEDAKAVTLRTTFVGFEQQAGVKAWKIRQTATADIDGDHRVQADFTFWVHPANGLILKGQGTLKGVPTNIGVSNWTFDMTALD